jgi:starch-binding outer membrane protein, SusD/RagB family
MKNIKILLFAFIGFSIFSCEDATNIIQDGEFSESATFKTVEDMKLFLNQTYAQVSITNEISFNSIFTDEVSTGSSNAGQNIQLYGFLFNKNDGNASALWLNHYTLINYSNRLLRGASRITPSDEELVLYNSILAQAKALRAFGHFQLLTYFSTDLKDDNALGVIKMDRVPLVGEQLPRNTNREIFDLIESDLDYAYLNVVNNPDDAKVYKYVNKDFINALRARMYLYRGKYALADQYASEVINNSGISLAEAGPVPAGTPGSTAWNTSFYGFASTSPYRRMFSDLDTSNRNEIIFSLDRPVNSTGGIAGIYYTNSTKLGGAPLHDMGRNLFNLFDTDANNPLAQGVLGDIRRYAFIDPTSKIDNATLPTNPNYTSDSNYKANDVLCIDKYPGKSGAALVNDIKVFRLSEMYLIKAESLAASGNLNGSTNSVASILKFIRDKRNFINQDQPLPIYSNVTEAWRDILLERRKELCFEGHRYIDLKRIGALANVTIDRYVRDCEINNLTTCSIPVTDHRFTFPIPLDEVLGNNNIQQNPEY